MVAGNLSPTIFLIAGLLALSHQVAFGQSNQQVGVLAVLVLDEKGGPLQREVEIDIAGERLNKKAFIQTRGFFDLPYGTYTIRCWTNSMIGPDRLVVIRQPKAQIVFALTPKEGDQIMGEGYLVPCAIKGKLTPPPSKGKIVIARLIGLYADVLEDAVVGEDGNFTLYAWRWSPYKLWILSDGRRIAERDVDVSPDLPKDAPRFEIHIPNGNPDR